jgi:hypothetical protein
MELYEIIKFIRKPMLREEYFEPVVITSAMDKNFVYKMLEIYQANQNENESYQIRTLTMPEAKEW